MQSWKWNCIILVILLMLKRDYIKTKNIENQLSINLRGLK